MVSGWDRSLKNDLLRYGIETLSQDYDITIIDGEAGPEQVTGHKRDWSSMTEVMEYSNQAYELISQIAELRKTVPCPLPGRLSIFFES